jgi:hypothetical protein
MILCLARLVAADNPSSLCIKVLRGSGYDISQECASEMFERTSARLPVCQNRDVLWIELRWVRRTYGSGNGSISEMKTAEVNEL